MRSEQPRSRARRIWWLVLLAILAWNVLLFWPRIQAAADIPYSTFLAQARAGNVAKVQIAGDQITGSFAQPVAWPVATVARTSTALLATPVPPVTYTAFRTTFPEAVGDPSLLPLLQAHAEHPFLGYELAQGRDYSEATAARIDQDVQRLLSEREEIVRQLLTDAREQLDRLALALLAEETIDEDELVRILGPRPAAGETESEQPQLNVVPIYSGLHKE
jgi:ATP-dependent Zn protease